jgi:hypothetical protein
MKDITVSLLQYQHLHWHPVLTSDTYRYCYIVKSEKELKEALMVINQFNY